MIFPWNSLAMKNKRLHEILLAGFGILSLFFPCRASFAVEIAPRISDKEIVEKLSKLEEGQKGIDKRFEDFSAQIDIRFENVDKRFEDVNRRIDDLRSEMNGRFDDLNNRFNDLNQRLNVLQWMFGLFITVALAIFAAIGKVLWELNRRQAAHEKIIQNLAGEIESLKQTDFKLMDQIKALIEALKPPNGVL